MSTDSNAFGSRVVVEGVVVDVVGARVVGEEVDVAPSDSSA
jgi:hypothetical protein